MPSITYSTDLPNIRNPPATLAAALGALTVLCWASYNVAAVHSLEASLRASDLVLLRFGVAGLVLTPALVVLRLREDRPQA